ncbi:hypothetical protein BUE61_26530 [Pseudomonas syringae pv. actinidiae]|nr:hypothetical protein BUE61_26530 [Pseudomonas syringae pv. actinidiae]
MRIVREKAGISSENASSELKSSRTSSLPRLRPESRATLCRSGLVREDHSSDDSFSGNTPPFSRTSPFPRPSTRIKSNTV